MRLIMALAQFSLFISNKSDEAECALNKPEAGINALSSRYLVQKGLEKLEG